MANEQHARSSLQASVEVGAAFLVAGTKEVARLEAENASLRDAISAHLDILSGKITGGVTSPSLVLASALDLRRLIGKEE